MKEENADLSQVSLRVFELLTIWLCYLFRKINLKIKKFLMYHPAIVTYSFRVAWVYN